MLELAVVSVLVLGIANTVAVLVLVRSARETLTETTQGLPLGAALPPFSASTLDGARATERNAAARLLLVLGISCRPCHQVARELAITEHDLVSRLLILVTGEESRGGDNLLELLAFMPGGQVARDPRHEIADRLAVPATPFVYAVDAAGRVRAKGLSASAAALGALAAKALGPA